MASDLQTVLAQYPASVRPSAEPEPLGNAGGLSGATLWRFRAGAQRLVVRAWPIDAPPRPVLERIHAWLAEASPIGFIPTPIATLDGRTLVEHGSRLWEVTRWIDGSPDLARPPGLSRVRAGFAGLAAFHQVLARCSSVGPSPGIVARLEELDHWLSGRFAELQRVLDSRVADRSVELARAWQERALRAAPRIRRLLADAATIDVVRQPCLRDARPEHFLFHADSLTGLIDFGAMGIESVAADLGRLVAEWLSDDPESKAEALASYTAIRPLDAREMVLISVFQASAALLTGGRWAAWHFLEERKFNDPSAVSRGLEKGVERVGLL